MPILFEPIGTFHCNAAYKSEAPRQGVFRGARTGKIELFTRRGFEEALRDLSGFERIWIIFAFHRNKGWRATTRPPVPPPDHERVGVFASRGPYRPNPLGLSCVKLLAVERLSVFVEGADLLNETPVLDIKPYIPRADAFPTAKAGWVDLQNLERWDIAETETFAEQGDWLLSAGGLDFRSFAECQLSNLPFDSSRRRVLVDFERKTAELAFRTFRIDFSFDENSRRILLEKIRSGYSAEELSSQADPYGDKPLHREFLLHFAQSPNA